MTHRLRDSDHNHHDIAAVLCHYGAEHVPSPATQRWTAMRCNFHDDRSASAQTDGLGFRCFTCSLFYPTPLALIKEREGTDWQGAHDIYHRVAGTGSPELSDAPTLRFGVSGQSRHRPTGSRSRPAGRRHRP